MISWCSIVRKLTRDALGRPHVAKKTVRWHSAGQESRNLRPLLRRQLGRTTQMWSTAQRLHSAALSGTFDPLAHRRPAHPQRRSDVFLPPSRLMQLPGALAPPLACIGRFLCAVLMAVDARTIQAFTPNSVNVDTRQVVCYCPIHGYATPHAA